MTIVKYRNFFFILSGILVLASLAAYGMWGLKLGIDFTGGTLVEVSYTQLPAKAELDARLAPLDLGNYSIRQEGESAYLVRTRPTNDSEQTAIITALSPENSGAVLGRLASVGPTVGAELAKKSLVSIALVILGIILYIAFAFRKVSRPVSSWVYGFTAIIGLVHNVIIPIGIFAWLGHTVGVEVDALFVAALLTILGFSVHDTIVVFDRTRENLRVNEADSKHESFEMTVGRSLQQTYTRSINTSLTVIFVLLMLFFLGGSSTEDFTLALLIGVIAGTYSSICIASPLLVTFDKWNKKPHEESHHTKHKKK
jgi:preprotein translocase subunit SecF